MTSTEKKAPSKKEESVFDWLKTLPPREGNIFFSLCEDGKKTVNKSKLKEAIFDAGLQINDFRLRSFFKKLDRHRSNDIEFEDFNSIIKAGGLLIEKALRGELAVPDFRDFSMNLDKIYDEIRPNRSGDLAKYIPPLAEVDPEQFGIAVVTTDGQIYQRGDSDVDFSIQSMCKVFNYSIVVENLGLDKVNRHVGAEPSGRQFDDLTLMVKGMGGSSLNPNNQIPFNPMVNAGAIMTTGLINPKNSTGQRLDYVREQFGRIIGWNAMETSGIKRPRFNKNMARQENFKGYNNIATGFLLMATGNIPHSDSLLPEDAHEEKEYEYDFYIEPAVVNALKVYFSICSLEMTAKDVAMGAATLANGGVCPITQDRVLSQSTVRNVLPVVQMAGMYNSSGKFFQEIGLPSKSGVGGGILLIVPQLMGICIFSPRLDSVGYSVRGLEVARKITLKYLVHLFLRCKSDL